MKFILLKLALTGMIFTASINANASLITFEDVNAGVFPTTDSCNLGYINDSIFGEFCSTYNADTNILSTYFDTSNNTDIRFSIVHMFDNNFAFLNGSISGVGSGDLAEYGLNPNVGNLYVLANNDSNYFSSFDIKLDDDLKSGDSISYSIGFSHNLVGDNYGDSVGEFLVNGNYTPSTKSVPEPSSIAIFGLALAGLTGLRKYKNKTLEYST